MVNKYVAEVYSCGPYIRKGLASLLKHCEYLWFFSNLAWISRVATRLGPMINQLLGYGLLDPNMTSFLVDGYVWLWFTL